MEKDQETIAVLPSTSSVGSAVDNEDVVAAGTASAMTTIEGEAAAASSEEDKKKKVFASEEQIRAVFSNNLVS